MFVWQHCRHGEVRWLDAYTCRCNDCGKTGIWYEDGLVLWCKRRTVDPDHHLSHHPSQRDRSVLETAVLEHAALDDAVLEHAVLEHEVAVSAEINAERPPEKPKRSGMGIPTAGIRFPHIPPNDHSSAAVA